MVVDEVLDADNKVALRCGGYLQLAFSLCQDIIRKKGSVKRNLKPDLVLRNAFWMCHLNLVITSGRCERLCSKPEIDRESSKKVTQAFMQLSKVVSKR